MLRWSIVSILAFATLTSIRASHMSGGEIYWDCIGPNQYRITMVIYRDCFGINVDPGYNLQVQSPCGNTSIVVTTPGGTEISQLCDQQLPNSTCNGGTLPGIQQYIYTGVITLPPCNFWTISYTNIYRNAAVVNLINPGAQRTYIMATLNNAAAACDDSPVFANTAVPYVCLGYPVSYSFGALDADGDSLSYALISAMGLNGSALNYTNPNTAGVPIPGLTLDPFTGQVNFTPQAQGNWVVVVRVNIWRNGVLIGTVMRDMQFVAYPCSNIPPDASTGLIQGLSGAAMQDGPRSITICGSGSFCFNFTITDPNPTNILTATTNLQQVFPGSTLTLTGTNPITGSLCATVPPNPSANYSFLVNVSDGACPLFATQTYVYTVAVGPGFPVTLDPVDATCTTNGSLTTQVQGGFGPYSYAWSTGATTPGISAGPGSYSVTVTAANGCVAQVSGTIGALPPTPSANAGPDMTVCAGAAPFTLNGSVSYATSGIWSGGSGSFNGTWPNIQYIPSAAEIALGSVTLTLSTSGNGTCPAATDAMVLTISTSLSGVSMTYMPINCNGGTSSATVVGGTAGYSYLWNDPTAQTVATASGLAAGSYSVLVTNNAGCTTTLGVTLTQPTELTITSTNTTPENCGGGGGTASVTASGSIAQYAYLWSTGDTTAFITAPTGIYTVQVTDGNNCGPVTSTLTIPTGISVPIANAGPDQTVCQMSQPVQLSGSIINASGGAWSGGSGTFSGVWPNISYTPSAADIASGSVDLMLTSTGSGPCAAASDVMVINLNATLTGVSVSSTSIACNGGTGSAMVVGGSMGSNFQWNDPSAQTTAIATGLVAGDYTVQISEPLGCDTTLSVTVSEPSSVVILDVIGQVENCLGDGSAFVAAVATGGTAPYTFQWNTGQIGDSIPATSGTYMVVAVDNNGCTSTQAQVTLLPADEPAIANAGPDITICGANASVGINGSVMHATGVSWSGGTGTFVGNGPEVVYFPSAQDYQVGSASLALTATSGGGCPPAVDHMVIILANNFAGASITGTSPLCNGLATGTATVSLPANAISFTWNDPASQSTAMAHGLIAGTYQVVLNDTLGCDTTLSVTLTEPTPLAVTLNGQDEGCLGSGNGSVLANASGGTGPYSYTWNTGATSSSINGSGGNYSVTVADANGCQPVNASITIGSAAQPNSADAGPDQVLCMGSYPVQLAGQITNATGATWSGGAGTFIGNGPTAQYTPSPQEIQNGIVTLVLTTTGNSACPPASDNVVLTLSNSYLNATLTPTAISCNGAANGAIAYTPVLPGLSFQWNDANTQNTPTATGLGPGDYSIQVMDALGCSNTFIALITQPAPLSVTPASTTPVSCNGGTNGNATLSIVGGTPGYTVAWNNGNTGTTASWLAAGTYTATVTDAAGCTATTSANVTQPPAIDLVANSPDTVCANAAVLLQASASGGQGGFQYFWSGLGTGESIQTTFTSSQLITLSVTDQAGCTGPMVILPIVVLNLQSATLTTYGDTTVCPGGFASVGAMLNGYTGSYTTNWIELGGTGMGPYQVPIPNDQVLNVVITDQCGQQIYGQVSLQLDEPPTVQLPPIIAEGCAPLTVQFPNMQLGNGTLLNWNLGNGNSTNVSAPVITYPAGTYSVGLTVTSPFGCSTQTVNNGQIIAHAPPTAAFTASPWTTDIDHGTVVFTNQSQGGIISRSWNFGDGGTSMANDPTHIYSEVGSFMVELFVVDGNGCSATVEHPVQITPVYDIVVPNAFSPNGSGGNGGGWMPGDLSNDVFYPFVRFVDEFRMRIFNRWGELIFESNDITVGWDGYYLGQLSPQDVYVVQTWIRFVDGKETMKLSDLTLFR